jgi:hypothetical protein
MLIFVLLVFALFSASFGKYTPDVGASVVGGCGCSLQLCR